MKDPQKQEVLNRRRDFTRRFYQGNIGMFFLSMLSTTFMALGNLFISLLMQETIDLAAGGETRFTLAQIVWLVLLAIMGLLFTMYLLYYSKPRFIRRAMEQYKDFAFSGIVKKSIGSFSEESSSLYLSALTNDAASIETNYLSKVFTLVQEAITFVGAFLMMLLYSPLLTLAAFLLSLLPVLASMLTGKRLAKQEEQVSARNESFMSMLKDALAGFSVIKSFKAEGQIQRLFEQGSHSAEEAKCRRRMTETLIQAIGMAAGVTAQFGVFLIGAYLALAGRGVTAGVVIVFVQLMNYVLAPISDVPQILANRRAANALIDKLARSIHENQRREGKSIPSSLSKGISLEGLSFAYEAEAPVLRNISFHFQAGRSYAIVGGSGSGKSTLLNLLMGSREDYAGAIRYDENELRSISADSLYELVSMVQQNVFVFNSSLRDNITMFRDFPEDKLERAICASGLSALWEARGGDYACGENGCALSGGERQRISIARSLLRDSKVLLVDEATAALDAATAASVTDSLLSISGLTRIVVTHRLEEPLLRRYDQILVLRNGSLAECGSFQSLMEEKGYFYSLFMISQ